MERKEFNIQGTVNTTPAPTDMDVSVDVSDMDFGSPAAGKLSDVVSRIATVTGTAGTVALSIGATDWVANDKVMAGNNTEVSLDAGAFVPVIVAGEVLLGNLVAGEYTLNFRVTPPTNIDLNTYDQEIVVIGE